jgi:3',5'-cyclic AMP phosphodiesterase CpdA
VAAEAGAAMTATLLHLSDPHFGTERPEAVDALRRLALAERPDLVVLSGDITQRARRRQFAAARAFLDSLGAPWLAVPGNHDIPLWNLPARLLWPYAGHRRALGDALEPAWESPRWLVLGVRTTRRWRHTRGTVSARQIRDVAERLARAAPAQLRVVVVHQPVAVTREEDLTNRLRRADPAVAAWAAAGADVVLGGHIHLPYVLPLAGLARPLWAVQAGTAVSHRVRDGIPNSVNLLRWDGRHALVERWDHDAGAQDFVRHGVSSLAPARARP